MVDACFLAVVKLCGKEAFIGDHLKAGSYNAILVVVSIDIVCTFCL